MEISASTTSRLYVGDARQTAYYLCTAFGFRVAGRVARRPAWPGQRTLLLGQGDIRIAAHLRAHRRPPGRRVRGPPRRRRGGRRVRGRPTRPGVRRGGRRRRHRRSTPPQHLRARPASTVVTAEVSGFGDVTHRLVERTGDAARVPARRDRHDAGRPRHGRPTCCTSSTTPRSACRPASSTATVAVLPARCSASREIFAEYIEVGGQGMDSKVVQSPSGRRHVHADRAGPEPPARPDRRLPRAGTPAPACSTSRCSTDDIVDRGATRSAAAGSASRSTPASYYDMLEARLGAVDVPVDRAAASWASWSTATTGASCSRSSPSPRTSAGRCFLELIERHGARTFGSGNIKALYEAKERELAARARHHRRPAQLIPPDHRLPKGHDRDHSVTEAFTLTDEEQALLPSDDDVGTTPSTAGT